MRLGGCLQGSAPHPPAEGAPLSALELRSTVRFHVPTGPDTRTLGSHSLGAQVPGAADGEGTVSSVAITDTCRPVSPVVSLRGGDVGTAWQAPAQTAADAFLEGAGWGRLSAP